MKNNNYIIIFLSAVFFIIGMLYLAYHQGWIIVSIPSFKYQMEQATQHNRAHKKKVTLLFWHNNKWNNETIDIIEQDDVALTLQHLINRWLTLLDEEHIMNKKVTLQSALIDKNKKAFFSFDRNPFDENNNTKEKLLWIEGLLKTVSDNGIRINSLQFLVHHQIMDDYHLDFSNPWPITGFLHKNK